MCFCLSQPVGWAEQGALAECESNFQGGKTGAHKKRPARGQVQRFRVSMPLVLASPLVLPRPW
jgi:hypothetical protein